MFLFEATGIMADTSVRPLAVQAKAGEMHKKGWVARIGSSYFCVYKGIADGVCHLGATSLTSTLPAYSCELTGRLKACSARHKVSPKSALPQICISLSKPMSKPFTCCPYCSEHLLPRLSFYISGMWCQPPQTKVFALPYKFQLHQSKHPGNAELMWA